MRALGSGIGRNILKFNLERRIVDSALCFALQSI
jgi:hypothetical protein